ncbi:hypothetical protein GW17_00056813 [Ensete ventricosum]|nr:hypothetical protein GW17_00056813 [Ensete ventricosum]RZS14430.1 hypothetical protein BHM03_00046113 [Ensete ventricosum]
MATWVVAVTKATTRWVQLEAAMKRLKVVVGGWEHKAVADNQGCAPVGIGKESRGCYGNGKQQEGAAGRGRSGWLENKVTMGGSSTCGRSGHESEGLRRSVESGPQQSCTRLGRAARAPHRRSDVVLMQKKTLVELSPVESQSRREMATERRRHLCGMEGWATMAKAATGVGGKQQCQCYLVVRLMIVPLGEGKQFHSNSERVGIPRDSKGVASNSSREVASNGRVRARVRGVGLD